MIVFITIPWFTPAYRAGGPVQSILNLVSNFNEGIEYHIFCGNTDLNGEVLAGVEADQWTIFNDHTQVWYASGEVSKTITTEVEKIKPDVLFIIGLFSWHYNIVPLLFCKAPLKILSARGMLHAGALGQKKLKKQVFLAALKIAGIRRKVTFHATDVAEYDFIKAAFGNDAKIAVAKNYGRKVAVFDPPEKRSGMLKLITIAIISPMKNYLKVLEAMAKSIGEIEYNIYGPVKDQAYWELCQAQIKSLPENITVHYHGDTEPNAIDLLLAENHVFIMPSESENFGHSIYEALSAGKPVITSNATPWNNLPEAKAGMNVNTETEEIKNAISLFVSMDNEEYKSFAAAAKSYIEQHTNEKEIDLQYRKLFQIN
jgi:glycosyltransferase involved in cell wall biosynthesis